MCMLSKRNSNSKDMKRTILIMLAALTMMTSASAQKTERTKAEVGGFYFGDAAKLDSMYNYWNNFVAQHPKDEIAWRNPCSATTSPTTSWPHLGADFELSQLSQKTILMNEKCHFFESIYYDTRHPLVSY